MVDGELGKRKVVKWNNCILSSLLLVLLFSEVNLSYTRVTCYWFYFSAQRKKRARVRGGQK